MLITVGSSAFAIASVAAQLGVSDAGGLIVESGDVVSPSTASAPSSLPAVGSGPIFHLDASRTNGWTFGTSGTSVRKIPSLVGNRYLMSRTGSYIHDLSKRDANNGLWDAGDYWSLVEPELAEDGTLGAAVLDFGEMGSRHAMLFDYENEPDTFQKTNQLSHIGTVIAVWNSEAGGGALLGGGIASNALSVNEGRLWMRGTPFVEATQKINTYVVTNVSPDNALFYYSGLTAGGGQSAYLPAVNGRLRLDSVVANPGRTGLNGGWQILSLMPTNALAAANGVGLGVVKLNNKYQSGGMKIAEMLIYGECLDEAEVAEVERYLAKKWFSRVQWGFDGAARAASVNAPAAERAARNAFAGTTNVFDVAGGERLSVGAVTYGRGVGSRIVKRGAGALSVGDLKRYAGTLSVEGGAFDFSPKQTPAAFPIKPSFHIDASTTSSILSTREENGTNFVDRIASLGTNYQGLPLYAVRQGTYNAPFLRYGMFDDVDGSPAPVLDFYDIVGNGNGTTPDKTGAFLRIARENGTTYPFLESICTLVAVVSPRTKGGFLVGNAASTAADPSASSSSGCYFDRTSYDSQLWTHPLLETAPYARIHPTLAPTNGLVMIDGVVRDVRSGYATRGFQVLALRVPASIVSTVGATWQPHFAGGFMIGELALWSRPLTEDEMRDASAHLYAKWFHRDLPGYSSSAEAGVPDVQNLEVAGDATVNIPAGRTMRVGAVAAGSSLSLSGGGVIEFVDGAPVTAQAQLAKNPSLDLDASDTNKMSLTSSGGMTTWFDKGNLNVAYVGDGNNPSLKTGMTPTGLPVVDMGNFRSNMRLTLERSLNSVRSAYVVMGTSQRTSGGGAVFGSSSLVDATNANYNDFPYGTDSNGYPNGPFCRNTAISPWSPLFLSGAERYIDGVATNTTALWRDDGVTYDLYEVHLPVGAHISGICNWNDNYLYSGGGRIAEMVVYERELSAREKVATRNYLMKKWLGTSDADLQPLPAEEPAARSLACISGDGTVVAGSLALSRLVADVLVAAVPSVTGTVVLGDEIEIVVANASELGREDLFVPCVACAAATGLSGCVPTFSGDVSWMSAGKKAELAYENGALGVRFRAPRGLMLMLK